MPSRSPHGERGLKFVLVCDTVMRDMSLSSWRAWIEIKTGEKQDDKKLGRSPHGERGLKFPRHERETLLTARRSPHGERGLKCKRSRTLLPPMVSLSSWRAWIEISEVSGRVKSPPVALLMESVD